MTRLFVSDIDGCLSEPYQIMDIDRLVELSVVVKEGGALDSHPTYPAFSLCSGRPIPYVECIAQLLGVVEPVLFESGGGMFNPRTAEVKWNPRITSEVRSQIDQVSDWMINHCLAGTSMVFDYAKRTQAGLIGPDHEEIVATIPRVQAFIDQNRFGLKVQPTHLSIDVVPFGMTKEFGMQWMANEQGLSLSDIAYIGDSVSDVEALKLVGRSFAPENADPIARESVDTVTAYQTQGVLDAVHACIANNKAELNIVS
ncbi:MAG: HAD hydrolase family protein [Rhodothermaceae bacterium]|nr:HAD hydrolase family protein [Rhodothermaceae bacterium]